MSQALYQQDAATRVIARLLRERDSSREQVHELQKQILDLHKKAAVLSAAAGGGGGGIDAFDEDPGSEKEEKKKRKVERKKEESQESAADLFLHFLRTTKEPPTSFQARKSPRDGDCPS